MSDTQKVQLMKAKRDAIMDAASLLVLTGMIYFIMNPDKYDRITGVVNDQLNRLSHWISVWQTKLSIRSLPETDATE